VVPARARPLAKAKTDAEKASVLNISDPLAVAIPPWGRLAIVANSQKIRQV
jgi:hypothetical protein